MTPAKKNSIRPIKNISKRDGSVVPFDLEKVSNAIFKSMRATGEGSEKEADKVAKVVLKELNGINKNFRGHFVPSVEQIQDLVEKELILHKYVATSKAYILYRERRNEVRREKGEVPKKVRELAAQSKKYFKNPLGEFIYYRTYSRWIPDENRRETWVETVDRYISFMKENLGGKLSDKEYAEVRESILKHEAMPSMRLLQFAGKAARSTNVCAYNCSYIAPTKWQDFAEVMYISMCGTGAGWAVESANIQELPIIKFQSGKKLKTHVVDDSKEGWCDALTIGMKTWADGNDIEFDFSQLRPAGARLQTMGGKSSGPDPLRQLLTFTRGKMLARQGKRLANIDAHDILCMIGNIVVAGGVRRSAMISISDLDDEAIRDAKKGQFYLTDPHRSLANNSAAYNQKPTSEQFLEEWTSLVKSGSGERGIFNRSGLKKTLPARRVKFLGDKVHRIGTNPCGEILLQSKQFCNLSEVVARKEDTKESLIRKIRVATIIGTYQATLTNFKYLSKEWKKNCEDERLLGVSITGQWDCPAVRDAKVLQALRDEAIKINKKYSEKFGINQSTCITCTKPSGNLSQTVDSSSGMHPRHSKHYIRRVRIAATDSLFKMLRDQGVTAHPEVGQSKNDATTWVLDFPVKAPASSKIFKEDMNAIEQLEYWKLVKENFTEHNPSVTVSVGENEWVGVAEWVYRNWDIVGGLSFLPRTDHVYQLAPYEEISGDQYEELIKGWKDIDFSKIVSYEKVDETENKAELACAGGTCEIDLPTEEMMGGSSEDKK